MPIYTKQTKCQNVSVKGVAYIPPSLSASMGFTLSPIKRKTIFNKKFKVEKYEC